MPWPPNFSECRPIVLPSVPLIVLIWSGFWLGALVPAPVNNELPRLLPPKPKDGKQGSRVWLTNNALNPRSAGETPHRPEFKPAVYHRCSPARTSSTVVGEMVLVYPTTALWLARMSPLLRSAAPG